MMSVLSLYAMWQALQSVLLAFIQFCTLSRDCVLIASHVFAGCSHWTLSTSQLTHRIAA